MQCTVGARKNSKSKSAQENFLVKVASINTNKIKKIAASNDGEEIFQDDAINSEDEDFFDEEVKDREPTKEEKEVIEKITGGLQGYLNQVKIPYLKNEGNDPVVSYNDIVGPFIIDWDETNKKQGFGKIGSGNIHAVSRLTEITVKYIDGTSEPVSEILQGEGNLVTVNAQGFGEPWKIESNKPFYVKNPNLEKEVVGIGIDLVKKAKFRSATYQIYTGSSAYPTDTANLKSGIESILKSKGYDSAKVTSLNLTSMYTPQKNMKVAGFTIEDTAEKHLDIGVEAKKGEVELTKFGIYGGGEEILANVTFKVYCDTVEKYIESTDGTVTFTPDMASAKEYVTDESGKLVISGLYAGREPGDGYTYKIIEVYKENNENYYYIDPIKIKSTEGTGGTVSPGHWKVGDTTYCTVENVVIYYPGDNAEVASGGQTITVKDDRTSGDLLIEKYDESFADSIKLEGVKFKIKLVRSYDGDAEHDLQQSQMWLKLPSACTKNSPLRHDVNNPSVGEVNSIINGRIKIAKESVSGGGSDDDEAGATVYDYSEFLHDEYLTDNEAEAGEFVTGPTGKIKLKCIINGKYEIYEVGAAEGYDITRQWYYGADEEHKDWVDYGKEEENLPTWGVSEDGQYYPHQDDHGLVEISTEDNYKKPVYSNRKIISRIEGNLWEDVPKGDKASGQYDSLNYIDKNEDKPLQEDDIVTVNLYIRNQYKQDGRPVRTSGYRCIASTTVDPGSGHWEIKKRNRTASSGGFSEDIYYWEISDAYIEYIYNNKQYVCTDVFAKAAGGEAESVKRNSKAQEEEMTVDELDDRKLSGVFETGPTQRNLPRKCNNN